MTTLTQEEAHRLFEYKDGKLFYKKCPRGSGKFKTNPEAGANSGHGYKKLSLNGKFYYTHQIIFLMQHGYIPKLVDHIDGNSENNAIENLRESNKSLNACNAKLQSNNTSGTKGVTWSKKIGQWTSRVQINKKVIHLGTFNDLELASLVADEARLLYHGKHARI